MIVYLATGDLTNDIIGDDADQAHNRAFSTNAIPASKVAESFLNYLSILPGYFSAPRGV